MSWQEFIALLVLSTASSFTPGPNTTLSTALSANHGLRRAMTFVLSVPLGWGLLFTLCAAGVGALVMKVPLLRQVITWGGCSYLLWMAFKLAHSHTLAQVDSGKLNVTFWQGVMLQFLNIKAWFLALTVVAGWLAGWAAGCAAALCTNFAGHAAVWFCPNQSRSNEPTSA